MANAFVNAAGDTTARVTDYILAARWSDLPDDVRRETLRSCFNILGCTIGGARHEVGALADKTLAEYAGSPHATVIGRGRKADALHASLINCLSSSIYSYDDTHAEAVVHPSGPVVTAALALAERRPAKGADFPPARAAGLRVRVPAVESDLGAAREGQRRLVADRCRRRHRRRDRRGEAAQAGRGAAAIRHRHRAVAGGRLPGDARHHGVVAHAGPGRADGPARRYHGRARLYRVASRTRRPLRLPRGLRRTARRGCAGRRPPHALRDPAQHLQALSVWHRDPSDHRFLLAT